MCKPAIPKRALGLLSAALGLLMMGGCARDDAGNLIGVPNLDFLGTNKKVDAYLSANLDYYPDAVRTSQRTGDRCEADANGWPMSFDFKQIPWWTRQQDFRREFVKELVPCAARVVESASSNEVRAIGLRAANGQIFDLTFRFKPQFRRGPGGDAETDADTRVPVRCGTNRNLTCRISNNPPDYGLSEISIDGAPAESFAQVMRRRFGAPVRDARSYREFVVVQGGVAPVMTTREGPPYYNLGAARAYVPVSGSPRVNGSFQRGVEVPGMIIQRKGAQSLSRTLL